MLNNKYKCCFIGKYASGKTSVIHTIMNKKGAVRSTLGIDFFTTTLKISNITASLSLWDTAGAERFRSLTLSYIRDSDIIFVVYDVSDINAMDHVKKSLMDIERIDTPLIAIMGNKTDLNTDCEHQLSKVIEPYIRQSWKIECTTCSIKSPEHIKQFFKKCLKRVIRPPKINTATSQQIVLAPPLEIPRKCCT